MSLNRKFVSLVLMLSFFSGFAYEVWLKGVAGVTLEWQYRLQVVAVCIAMAIFVMGAIYLSQIFETGPKRRNNASNRLREPLSIDGIIAAQKRAREDAIPTPLMVETNGEK